MRKQTRYPPLLVVVIPVVLALLVLPSALNLPVANPSTTLEYAPVPPEDDVPNAPPGNLATLGLPTGQTLADGALPPVIDTPELGGGLNPLQKRCVGRPPRQTEDLLSPPCVGFFEGDNFGKTYRGVDRDEIRVLITRHAGGSTGTSRGSENPPDDTYYDLTAPPSGSDPIDVRVLKVFQRHFNDRYQTYGRRVKMTLYYDRADASETPQGRRADAADNLRRVDPFAVLSYHPTFSEVYIDAMAKQGVLNFAAPLSRPQSFFRSHPGLIWGYLPSLEEQAEMFSAFVCKRVVGHPVSAAGTDMNGRPRKLGLLYATDESKPTLKTFALEVKKRVAACGGTFIAEGTYPVAGNFTAVPNRAPATVNMARFQTRGVTTVIWPQGYEVEHSKAARRITYQPEWIVAGDGQHEGFGPAIFHDQNVWSGHAWVVTPTSIVGSVEQTPCYHVLNELAPGMPATDKDYTCSIGWPYYNDLRQLFTGIQVAGPRLTPSSIDEGFHAIPPHRSTDPSVPACYYDPGDYTCVKDVVSAWWDRSSTNAQGLPGCWRLAEGGQRHTAMSMPRTDGLSRKTSADRCNQYQGGVGGVVLS